MIDQLERAVAIHCDLDSFRHAEYLVSQADLPRAAKTRMLDQIADQRERRPWQGRSLVSVPLVLKDEGVAVVVGLTLSHRPFSSAKAFDDAVRHAIHACNELLGIVSDGEKAISLGLDMAGADAVKPEGGSIGLAAALNYFMRLTGLKPADGRLIVASGEVVEGGRLIECGELDCKLDAICREGWGTRNALVLLAGPKRALPQLDEMDESLRPDVFWTEDIKGALEKAFGPVVSQARSLVRKPNVRLQGLMDERRWDEALEMMGSRTAEQGRESLARWDWFRAQIALHRGDSDAADRYQALENDLRSLLDEGEFKSDEFGVFLAEMAVGMLDGFEFEPIMGMLNDCISGAGPQGTPYRAVRVHLQGSLAQACAMLGRHTQAVLLREKNLTIQRKAGDEETTRTLARTLCNLAWESFRAGHARRAWQHLVAAENLVGTGAAEQSQELFNFYTRLRMLFWSGRYPEVGDLFRRKEALAEGQGYPANMIRIYRYMAMSQQEDPLDKERGMRGILKEIRDRDGENGLVSWLVVLGLGWAFDEMRIFGEFEVADLMERVACEGIIEPSGEDGIHLPASRFFARHFGGGDGTDDTAAVLRNWLKCSWY